MANAHGKAKLTASVFRTYVLTGERRYVLASMHNRRPSSGLNSDHTEISNCVSTIFLSSSCHPAHMLSLSLPPTQACPRIASWWWGCIASSWIASIAAWTAWIVCRLHRAIVLRRRSGRRRRRMPAWWKLLLLLLLLLLTVCMLCCSRLAVILLSWWRREVLLVGWWRHRSV